MIETRTVDEHYARLIGHILFNGEHRQERTGTGAKSIFGYAMQFDLSSCFPLLSLKTVSYKTVWEELRWMLSGSTNINDLNARIWDEWADKNGDLGPVYGAQWRHIWECDRLGNVDSVDQISNLITSLRENPNSRRHVVSAWNVSDIPTMALPPCHMAFQVFCGSDNSLSLQMHQRSCDVFLGLPYNIAGYAFLTHLLANMTGRWAKSLSITLGDAHIYDNHVEQCELILERFNSVTKWELFQSSKQVRLSDWTNWDRDWTKCSIDELLSDKPVPIITGYRGMGKIEGKVAV